MSKPTTETNQVKVVFSPTYTFRLRKHLGGNFAGLWELCLLNSQGLVKETIEDANALNFCIENMMGRLEDDGY